MTLLLVILAVLGAGFVVVMALGRFTRPTEPAPDEKELEADPTPAARNQADDDGALVRRWKRGEVPMVRGLVEPAQNLPPVLLPDDPDSSDVDRLRFSAGFRGYRMDQVDDVLDILRDALAAKEQRLAELEKERNQEKEQERNEETERDIADGPEEESGQGHNSRGAAP